MNIIKTRKRALDGVESDPLWETKWKAYNALFSGHIQIFDHTFERGAKPDLKSYVSVCHTDGTCFSDTLLQLMLSAKSQDNQSQGNHKSRKHILSGHVGRGKSIFSRYIVEKCLVGEYINTLGVYVDAHAIAQWSDRDLEKTKEELKNTLKDNLIKRVVEKQIYARKADFFKALLAHDGYDINSDEKILASEKYIDLNRVLDFLLTKNEVAHVLIIIDNLDECKRNMIDAVYFFVESLFERGGQTDDPEKISVLLPLRSYTENYIVNRTRFSNTKKYAISALPAPNYLALLNRRIELLKDKFQDVTKNYYGDVVARIRGADPQSPRSESYSGLKYEVNKHNIVEYYLPKLCEYLLCSESEFASFLINSSAGNCKNIVAELYYFFHSCKLVLDPVFEQAFLSPNNKEARKVVFLPNAIEYLLAIHYPFYDTKASLICNIFNADVRRNAPDRYENTLIIPKILLRLVNSPGELKYGQLRLELREFQYDDEIITAGFAKLIRYGLISASEGFKIEDWDKETIIHSNQATEVYIKQLVIEPSYLQYISEDVLMPQEYVVRIEEKYGRPTSKGIIIGGGSKYSRIDSIMKFLMFIEHEEGIEQSNLSDLSLSKVKFLENYGIDNGGKNNIFLSQFMKDAVTKAIKTRRLHE